MFCVVSGRRQEYKLWKMDLAEKRRASRSRAPQEQPPAFQSLISFPYLLSPAIKAGVLELDARKLLDSCLLRLG